MLDQLQEIIQQQAQESVVNNPAIPDEQNSAVMNEAGSSIFSSMQQMLQEGGPAALTQLFQGAQSGDASHPAVQQVTGNFASNIASKLGIDSGTAMSVASSLVPIVLNKFFHKTNDPNDSSLSITSVLGSLMGGGQQTAGAAPAQGGSGFDMGELGSLASSIGGKLGLDKNGDGNVDFKDLMGMFGH